MYRIYFDNFGYDYHFEITFALIFYFNRKFKEKIKFYFHPGFIKSQLNNNKQQNSRLNILQRFDFFDQRIKIKKPNRHDLRVILTVYQKKDLQRIQHLKNQKNILLIAHLYHPDFNDFKNIIYLTPIINQSKNQSKNPKNQKRSKNKFLLPAEFPYPKVEPNFSKLPIFLIQGNIQTRRRNYKSLLPIFQLTTPTQPNSITNQTDFRIMILGRGELPDYLQPYQNKIILKANLNDEEYHEAIQEATFILPLVDNTFKHDYFKKKLTSSISYGIGFGLRFIIFDKLAKIYQLNDQYIYFNSTQQTNQKKEPKDVNILPAFQQALNDFYKKNLKPRPMVPNLYSSKLLT